MNGVEASVPGGPRFATADDMDRKHRISLKAKRPKENEWGPHPHRLGLMAPPVDELPDDVHADL